MFRDLARQQNVFTGVAAHVFFDANLAYLGQTEHMKGLAVSGSYFRVLGLQPALGRLFSPVDDAVIDEPHAVVLNYDYWRTRFGADPAVLNQTLTLNGQQMTIIGVAPDGFRGTTVGSKPNVFLPMTMMRFAWPGFHHFEDRKFYWAYLFARLKPGVTIGQAEAAINPAYRNIINDVDVPLLQHMSEQELAQFRAKQINLEPGSRGQSALPDETRTALFLLLGLTALVPLIACANITNLLLARGAMRTGEMAVRLSIGASRAQLMRQLLVESFVLAALGGVASILIAEWTLSLIGSILGSDQTILQFEVDTTAIMFTAAVSIG